jgi:hypothetical protein
MGINNSKVECIWRAAQSGKTRTYQKIIKDYELLSDLFFDCEGFINIVLCSNNKSLVQQTADRHNRDLYDDTSSVESDEGEADAKINGNVFSWFSGTKKNGISPGELAFKICKNEVSMVVCCGHMKRIEYLYALIEELNSASFFMKKVNVWVDEADESINKWSKDKVNVSKFNVVHSITLISATFDSVIKKYGKIKVKGFNEPHPENYIKFTDCDVKTDDTIASSSFDYLQKIYEKNETILCKPGIRLFAPGDVTRESHEQITEFLCKKGFAVLILNGERKEIVKPNGEILKVEDYVTWERETPEEIGKTITKIYIDSGLNQFPFAMTGQMCLNRGLTFQNEQFLFDIGIAFNMADRAIAYQCLARMFGNIKRFINYKKCTIITTTRMKKLVEQAENIAVNVGKLVYEKDLMFVDKDTISVAEVNINAYRIYKDKKVLKSVCEILGYAYRKVEEEDDGFIRTSLNNVKSVVSLKDAVKKVPTAYGSNNGVKTYRVYYPCYIDTSDSSTLRYVVIIRPGTDDSKIRMVDEQFKSIPYSS